MRSREPGRGQRVGIMSVNDVEMPLAEDFSEQARATPANVARRNGVDAKAFGRCTFFDSSAAERNQLDSLAARAQAAEGEQDLILAAAPVRARIQMDGRDGHGGQSVEAVRRRSVTSAISGVEARRVARCGGRTAAVILILRMVRRTASGWIAMADWPPYFPQLTAKSVRESVREP